MMRGNHIVASIALICAIVGGVHDVSGWGWFLLAAILIA